ncbi:hypothetical protein PENTCL1PPCAC_2480, partial [Pristionchus entomophagus]
HVIVDNADSSLNTLSIPSPHLFYSRSRVHHSSCRSYRQWRIQGIHHEHGIWHVWYGRTWWIRRIPRQRNALRHVWRKRLRNVWIENTNERYSVIHVIVPNSRISASIVISVINKCV